MANEFGYDLYYETYHKGGKLEKAISAFENECTYMVKGAWDNAKHRAVNFGLSVRDAFTKNYGQLMFGYYKEVDASIVGGYKIYEIKAVRDSWTQGEYYAIGQSGGAPTWDYLNVEKCSQFVADYTPTKTRYSGAISWSGSKDYVDEETGQAFTLRYKKTDEWTLAVSSSYNYEMKFESNCLFESLEECLDAMAKGVNPEPEPPSRTRVDFKLWFNGERAPSYKLNWHNLEMESEEFDFSNTKIHIKAVSLDPLSDISQNEIACVPWNDGSYRFTWYDIENCANPNLQFLFPWVNFFCYASYDDTDIVKSGTPSVDLAKTKQSDGVLPSGLFKNVTVSSEDGSTITVINAEDDPNGYSSDEEDYHNPDEGGADDERYDDPNDDNGRGEDPTTPVDISGQLCRPYKIDAIELRKLAQSLWADGFLDNFHLVNNNPIENILSLKCVLGSATAKSGASAQTLKLGNVETNSVGTECNSTITLTSQPYKVKKHYNNFLDLAPYTSVSIYLPFYGMVSLDTNMVMNRNIVIKYIIDVITGTAKIKILLNNTCIYEFKTSCSADLPITSSNRASVEMGYLASAVGIGASAVSGNVVGAVMSGLSGAETSFHSTTSGSVSGTLDFSDSRMCTIIVDRPIFEENTTFNNTHGRMCNLSLKLGNLTGYTKCAQGVNLKSFNGTSTEKDMLLELLTTGIFM